jgi:hypothetical protein
MYSINNIARIVAIVAAGFIGVVSTKGLAAFLPGAAWIVMGLGALFEIGMLVSFEWLRTHWSRARGDLKAAVLLLSTIVLILDGFGMAGMLSMSYMERNLETQAGNEQSFATVDAKIEAAKMEVADFDRQLAEMDKAIAAANEAKLSRNRARVEAAEKALPGLSNKREVLIGQRKVSQAKVTDLQIERGSVKGKTTVASGERAAVQFVAHVFHTAEDTIASWYIVTIGFLAILFPPFLMVMAGHSTEVKEAATARLPHNVISLTKSAIVKIKDPKRVEAGRKAARTKRRKKEEALKTAALQSGKVAKIK